MFNMPMAAIAYQPPQVPPRIQAALQFVQWASTVGLPPISPIGTPYGEPRDLTAEEKAAYNAALESLRLYFAGEMDYGDCAPTAMQAPGDEEPQSPVPVA